MAERVQRVMRRVPCDLCPLRRLPVFRPFTQEELVFINTFKMGELNVDRGTTIIAEGSASAHLYTVLSGWAFRFKLLSDGRRQILNFVMPGDLVGLQGSVMGEMQHSVEALSPMVLCVFERSQLFTLYRDYPGLAFDITWIASREEQMLDENLLSVGRRSAVERAAYLLAFLASRALTVGLVSGQPVDLPLTQQHVADTLGLSLVHTNKTLRRLAMRGLLRWHDKGCEITDLDALKALSGWEGLGETVRPLV